MPDAPFAGAASLSFQYGQFVNKANDKLCVCGVVTWTRCQRV